MRFTGRSLEQVFDPRANSLNLVRLTMATGVILFHSFRLTGTSLTCAPIEQGLSQLWVDGFFSISGYLITSSWMRQPVVRSFLRNRFLRIYPGYIACLLFTAFALAPVGAALGHEPIELNGKLRYVVENLLVYQRAFDISGTPDSVPFPKAWNGSLWTLFYEIMCYLGVLVVGVVGLLRCRWTIPVATAASLLLQTAVLVSPTLAHASLPLGTRAIGSIGVAACARFLLAFMSGALVYWARDRIPCSWGWVVVMAVVVLSSLILPSYRILGAIPLAYALIAFAALIKTSALRLPNDISYGTYIYAFPVQQVLASGKIGLDSVPTFFVLAMILTFMLAYISWRVVEQPSLDLKQGKRNAPPSG